LDLTDREFGDIDPVVISGRRDQPESNSGNAADLPTTTIAPTQRIAPRP
jgi:hypothetical protein